MSRCICTNKELVASCVHPYCPEHGWDEEKDAEIARLRADCAEARADLASAQSWLAAAQRVVAQYRDAMPNKMDRLALDRLVAIPTRDHTTAESERKRVSDWLDRLDAAFPGLLPPSATAHGGENG